MTETIMALQTKQNNYEKLIKDLFKRHGVPLNRPEFKTILEEGEKATFGNVGSFALMDKYFEEQVIALTEKIRAEEEEKKKRKVVADKVREYGATPNLPLSGYRNHPPFMSLPFFATAKATQTESYEFNYTDEQGNARFLHVKPLKDYGQPDQRDADVLRCVLSKIGELFLRYDEIADTVTLTRAEILRSIGKGDGKEDYKWLKNALDRLSSTHYKTNTLYSNAEEGFSGTLISYKLCGSENEGGSTVVVTLAKAFYEALAVGGNAFLQIDEKVIKEKSNLRKAVLELVAKSMGEKLVWEISLKKLKERLRNTTQMREFKRQLSSRLNLPFSITFRKGKMGDEIVTFTRIN